MANYVFPNIPQAYQIGDTITFPYTGDVQTMDISSCNIGRAKIECWGARGEKGGENAGLGGYAYGVVKFPALQEVTSKLYFVVGQYRKGNHSNDEGPLWESVTFGGGGSGDNQSAGGASDVRTYYNGKNTGAIQKKRPFSVDKGTLNPTSLASRIIVAGGGGAGDNHQGSNKGPGADGGGWEGDQGNNAPGGNQFYGGSGKDGVQKGSGGFGYGGTGGGTNGAGGGGLYGGGALDGGGGGSSYVSGDPHCPFKTSSGITLSDTGTQKGVNDGPGRILVTILSLHKSKTVRYKKKNSTVITKISLEQISELNNRPSYSALLRVNDDYAALAFPKNDTPLFDQHVDVPRQLLQGDGIDRTYTLYSYSSANVEKGRYVLKGSFQYYVEAPGDLDDRRNCLYFDYNGKTPALYSDKNYIELTQNIRSVDWDSFDRTVALFSACRPGHNWSADTSLIYTVNFLIPFVIDKTKNFSLKLMNNQYNSPSSGNKNSNSWISMVYPRGLTISCYQSYDDMRLSFTDLKFLKGGTTYCVVKNTPSVNLSLLK